MRASLMKLKRARWTTAARSRCEVGAEEDGCPEDPLEGSDQTTILRTTLLHRERVQHLRGAFKSDPRTFLADRERRQKNGDQPILPPGQTVARMPGDLQNELAVPSFVEEAARC
jgi:hypothetical protein